MQSKNSHLIPGIFWCLNLFTPYKYECIIGCSIDCVYGVGFSFSYESTEIVKKIERFKKKHNKKTYKV